MPVTIGQARESDYTNPLGVLSDCHRRIEGFLNLLVLVTEQTAGAKLRSEERAALETALRYFREAAPKHTRDEEESLFPRLRAVQNPLAQAAFSLLDTLQKDHETADLAHQEVESICQRWLADDGLAEEGCDRLRNVLATLKTIYVRHIAVEDTQVFPLARNILGTSDIEAIAGEMAARRGVDLPARGELDSFIERERSERLRQ
jgi:hemerythrin-like domain-containing protein